MRLPILVGVLVAISFPSTLALAQSPPSSPHPRLFMSADDLTAYVADASHHGSPTARAISDCQDVIDHPDDLTMRGGSDGKYGKSA